MCGLRVRRDKKHFTKMPSLLILPLVPNITKKHKKHFQSALYALPKKELASWDVLAAHATSVSHGPGLMLKAANIDDAVINRFSGPSSLEHFNSPFMSKEPLTHLVRGLNLQRSTAPWFFLSDSVPSLQTQPMSFFSFCALGSKAAADRGKRTRPGHTFYDANLFFINFDLQALNLLPRNSLLSLPDDPVQRLHDLLEAEFTSFFNMLAAKHSLGEHDGQTFFSCNVKGRIGNARVFVDQLVSTKTSPANKFKAWRIFFRNQDDLLELLLRIKSKILTHSTIMRSTDSIESKIAKKWI